MQTENEHAEGHDSTLASSSGCTHSQNSSACLPCSSSLPAALVEDSSSKNYRFFKSGEDQETCGGDLDFSLVSLPGTLLLRMRRHREQHQWPTPCPALPFKHPHRSTGTRLGFSAATTNLDSVLCEDMGELAEGKINYERKKVLGRWVEG